VAGITLGDHADRVGRIGHLDVLDRRHPRRALALLLAGEGLADRVAYRALDGVRKPGWQSYKIDGEWPAVSARSPIEAGGGA
jgi:hypothetical protein